MNIKDYEIFNFAQNIYTPFLNNGVLYQLNQHPYLDIVLTDRCNSHCGFCCADLIHKKLDADFEVFKSKIQFAVEYMNVKEVLILGGEPTVSPILIPMIKFLKTLKLDKIVMTTNGYRLKDEQYCRDVVSAGLTHINVSMMNLNASKQQEISRSANIMKWTDLGTIHSICRRNNVKLRINNNIFKGNNDTFDELFNFYDVMKYYCDSIKFSPLLPVDNFSVKNETSSWVNERILSEEAVEKLFKHVEYYYSTHHDFAIIENNEQFGFVKNTMIPMVVPMILNWNVGKYTGMMDKVVNHNQINNIKLLPNNELSLSWNRELDKYFIKTF